MPHATLVLALAVAFGAVAQALFHRQPHGLNMPAAAALLLAIAWSRRATRPHAADWWLPGFALAFAVFTAVRSEPAVVAFDVLAMLVLIGASAASLRGIVVTRLTVPALIRETWDTASGSLWRAAAIVRDSASHVPAPLGRARGGLAYLAGIALAIPFLAIFTVLFTSADPVFARWLRETFDLGRWIGEARDRALIAFVLAWLAAGLIGRPQRAPTAERELPRPVGHQVATGGLASIAVLFAAFVLFQLAYLFGGRDTLEAAGITYSEYARRGFFELLAVSAIVVGALFAVELVVDRPSRAYRTAALMVLGLTAPIVASALYRLDLYQRAYGWSELRLYAFAALVTITAALLITAAAVALRRTTYALQPIVIVALGVALLVNAVGPSAFVVRANVARLADPAEARQRLDSDYLVGLGDGGIAEIVALRDRIPERERFCVDVLVFWRYGVRAPRAEPSWQGWNLDRSRSHVALAWLQENVFPALGDPASAPDRVRLSERYHAQCEARVP